MKYFVFRNSTLEPFFTGEEVLYSGYEDISQIDLNNNIFIWFYTLPTKSNNQLVAEEISSYLVNLKFVYGQIPKNKPVYIFTLPYSNYVNIVTGDFSLRKSIAHFNLEIYDLAENNRNVKVLDINNFIQNYPFEQLIDWRYYFISKLPFSPKLIENFRIWFHNQVESIHLKRKKCIIFDLDNTLWSGILGEDGIDGIKIGGEYPGNVFLEFQNSLLEISKSGIILAVCSKNNEKDVIDVWEKNPFLAIRKEHISAYRINWKNKSDNINELARELNIGLDSIVFIDDNPAERELVKQLLPMVVTPDFPQQPYELPVFVNMIIDKYFKIYSLTDEDKTKVEQYRSNSERAVLQKKYSNFSDYLKSLEIEIQLQEANSFNIPRIAQMSQKTNQFNLTSKRYTEVDIFSFLEHGDIVYCINVKDKFGDNGITGLAILELKRENGEAIVDSFLLSCRILGRGIEDAFLFLMLKKLKLEGFKTVYASYISTPKNEQVENFYDKAGFSVISENWLPSYEKRYKIDLCNRNFEIATYFKIF
jgi:FkbH-like protein